MPLTHGLQSMRDTAKASFWQKFETTEAVMSNVVFNSTSTSDQETYPALSAAPSMIEMQGSRTHKSVPEFSYVIKNRKWESTVNISYEMWKFNKLDIVGQMAAELGYKAKLHPDSLVTTLMEAGVSTAGPDGQFFFDTDHSDAGADYTTSQDNDLTLNITTVATPTDLEWASALRLIRAAMIGFKDGQGDPVLSDRNVIYDLHVPSGYEAIANRVNVSDTLTGPIGNDMKGRFNIVHNPRLAAHTGGVFYALNPTGIRKPFVLQTAEAISFDDSMGTDFNKETKDHWMGTFGYHNAGYGDWRYASIMTLT